ncbi:MAG: polysaccharide deacetylase family protein [Thermomicrobiales bacterium]|nr:polysaccharide deacetylase family protein [Thermomicrobiales bacterium]
MPTGTADDGYTRTVAEFRRDLGLLYELGYYVVPLRDIVADEIRAPLGKHPVALTFDDGTANHMRYLVGVDGSVSIDPESAVGILEAFFAEHPDFGRGGYFAVPPQTCFDWQKAGAEPDQTPFCAQKLRWLLDHGYEVGNHTLDHADLLDLDDDAFMNEVGGGWLGLVEFVPGLEPNILAMPYGNYPDSEAHPGQRQLLRDGFRFRGVQVSIAGALMVGADPAVSPSSTEWDPLYIARIRAYDGELGATEWLNKLAEDPESLYTSDGDPETITLPLPLEGTLDRTRAGHAGKQIIEYDPATGAAIHSGDTR